MSTVASERGLFDFVVVVHHYLLLLRASVLLGVLDDHYYKKLDPTCKPPPKKKRELRQKIVLPCQLTRWGMLSWTLCTLWGMLLQRT